MSPKHLNVNAFLIVQSMVHSAYIQKLKSRYRKLPNHYQNLLNIKVCAVYLHTDYHNWFIVLGTHEQ